MLRNRAMRGLTYEEPDIESDTPGGEEDEEAR